VKTVAAIIGHVEAQARAACAAVQVDWEVLPHVLDVEEQSLQGPLSSTKSNPEQYVDYGLTIIRSCAS